MMSLFHSTRPSTDTSETCKRLYIGKARMEQRTVDVPPPFTPVTSRLPHPSPIVVCAQPSSDVKGAEIRCTSCGYTA